MTDEEGFHDFLSRLQPHLQEHVGDLEAAIAIAQRLEVYHGGDGAKVGGAGKGSKAYKNQQQKKGIVA